MIAPNTDPETTVTTAQNSPPAPDTDGSAPKRNRTLLLVLGVLCVAAAVVVGLLAVQAISAGRAQKDADAALDAVRTRTVVVLSYDPKTVDADIQRAREQLSGTFAAQFDQLVTTVVVPASKQQGLSSKVDVTHAALIESQPDHADAVLLLHQAIATTAQPRPQEGTLQVKVTVTKGPDGQWLISNLQPI